jgi:N-methylhydantoinase A
LGHFAGGALLGGAFKLDGKRSEVALAQLAGAMSKAAGRSVTVREAAQGVLEVVNANMERALRHISVERGYDPREFALMPFGGAGGLHAVDLARALRLPRVIVPLAAGALSAIGVVAADVVKDQSRTVMLAAQPAVQERLQKLFVEMEEQARDTLIGEGFTAPRQRHERLVAMRYKGQSFELELPWSRVDLAASFHRAHQARYGYAQPANAVEIVSARLRSLGLVKELPLRRVTAAKRGAVTKPKDFVVAYLNGRKSRVGVYVREELRAGMKLQAPCIVTEYSSTTVIPTGASVVVDEYANLIITL